jgi:hypothetical protein
MTLSTVLIILLMPVIVMLIAVIVRDLWKSGKVPVDTKKLAILIGILVGLIGVVIAIAQFVR